MRHIRLNLFTISLVVLSGIGTLPEIAAAQYNVASSVVGSGGAALAGTTYNIAGTIGQLAPGSSGNSSDSVHAGLWYLQNYIITGVKSPSGEVAKAYELYQNFPNPFNPSTVISYQSVSSRQRFFESLRYTWQGGGDAC